MSFERRQPSVDLRAFLDPLKPGEYFDCGAARLYGIDEALEAEARRRGRAVGDDDFQLVATNGGLIFCRASIMFAIAARWKDLTIGRPEDGGRPGEVLLPISWPTHGDLQFTVSRRLGSNIFRRWLQLQAQATRRSQVEQDVRFERTAAPAPAAGEANGHSHSHSQTARNGHAEVESPVDDQPERNGCSTPTGIHATDVGESIDLRRLDDADREAIEYATEHERRRRRPFGGGEVDTVAEDGGTSTVDPLATIDAAVVDDWVDDRVPHVSNRDSAVSPSPRRVNPPRKSRNDSKLFEDDATADPFNGHEFNDENRRGVLEEQTDNDAVRFEVRPAAQAAGSPNEADGRDAIATRFMQRTVDGTDIFLEGATDGDAERFGRPHDRRGEVDARGRSAGGGRSRKRHVSVPVPEISGARLQLTESPTAGAGPQLDIRSTLLSGRPESEWVELLRRRKVLILGVVTIVALGLIALIGFLTGGGGDGSDTAADVAVTAEAGAGVGIAPSAGGLGADQGAVGSSTTVAALSGASSENATIDSTAPTLRVSSTSVQICHSNYGGCVPVAADVDCEGDGDGPAFQATPVAVFGDDVYELDTDDDREACEADQPRLGAAGGGG